MLARELHQELCLRLETPTIIEVSPDPRAPELMVVDTEIILGKKSLYRHFGAAHQCLQKRLLLLREPAKKTSEDALDDYYNLLLYLLTTNENHTVIRLHENDFWRIYCGKQDSALRRLWIRQEFRFVLGVVNMRSKRINKSSSLWFLMKKLAVACVFSRVGSNGCEDDTVLQDLDMLVECMAISARLHFANYYCHGFIKWVFVVILVLVENGTEILVVKSLTARMRKIYITIKELAMLNLGDVSHWNTLGVILQLLYKDRKPQNDSNQLRTYAVEEYNMISSQINMLGIADMNITLVQDKNTDPSEFLADFEAEKDVSQLIDYLDYVKCRHKTPYAVLRANSES